MNKHELQEMLRKSLREMEVLRQKYAGKDAPAWTESDTKAFEDLVVEQEGLEKQLDMAERAEKVQERLKAVVGGLEQPGSQKADPNSDLAKRVRKSLEFKKHKSNAEMLAMLGDDERLKVMDAIGALVVSKGNYNSLSADQRKALQADIPSAGGFLISPMQFVQELIQNVHDLVFIRQMARNFKLGRNETLGAPVLTSHVSDADWTAEVGTIQADTALTFGRRELKPNQITKLVLESRYLLNRDTLDAAGIVKESLAYKFGVTEEKAFLSGNGAGQPLGVFTADAQGISTARDNASATSGYIVADDFVTTKFSLKQQYWDRGVWMLSRPLMACTRKLKDANGNYIWSTGFGPGLGFQGLPPTLMDSPYYVSEYAPGTDAAMGTSTNSNKIAVTTGTYYGIFGDFSNYWIVDAEELEMQVLTELYALNSQVGIIGRRWLDGAPVKEEAFGRLIAS